LGLLLNFLAEVTQIVLGNALIIGNDDITTAEVTGAVAKGKMEIEGKGGLPLVGGVEGLLKILRRKGFR